MSSKEYYHWSSCCLMLRLQIDVFGPAEVQLNGNLIEWFPTDRVRALVLLLAAQPTLSKARGTVASLLWSDVDDKAARRNLRVCLVRLKKVLGDHADEILTASRQEIGLLSAESTYTRFQTLANSRRPADWQTAVDMVSGEFAAGFELKNSLLYEEWLAQQRQALHKQQTSLLQKLLDTPDLSPGARLRNAQQLASLMPYDDAAQRQVMLAQVALGNLPAAIAHFEQYTSTLRNELGTKPEAATVQLRDKMSATLLSRPATLHNVPSQVTEFVGRDTERDAVVELLRQPSCRMVTLLGAGGLGKTRLSIEVAQRLETDQFADGVYFAPLVTANSAFDVLAILNRTLGLATQGDDLEEQLYAYLADKRLLLILDNVEQLTGELRFLARLLEKAAGVKLLVTSRDVVGISAENRFPLTGISDLHDASTLLWSAIKRIAPDFELTATNMAIGARICEQLHGVPLALELAATWINTLDLDSIRDEIEHAFDFLESPMLDTPDRHRSLGAIFDHSWVLLTPKHQQMLAAATVFRGGFELKAARAVLGAGVRDLRRLVEQSLLVKGDSNRYTLHEMVRQFASDKLDADAGAVLKKAHAAHYLKLVADRETQLVSEDARAASTLISADLDNITSAWRWAVAQRDTAELERSIIGLIRFYRLTSRFSEGDRLFEETIEQLGTEAGDHLLARLHIGCSTFRMWQSRHEASVASAELAHRIAIEADDQEAIAESLLCQGRALRSLGRWFQAVPGYQQCVMIAQTKATSVEQPNRLDEIQAEALGHMALLSIMGASYKAGVSLSELAIQVVEKSGNKLIESFVLSVSAFSQTLSGHHITGLQVAEKALQLSRKLGTPLYEALALSMRGRAYMVIGDYAQALVDGQRSYEVYQSINENLGQVVTLMQLVRTHCEAGNFETALPLAIDTIKRAETGGIPFYAAYTSYWKGLALCSLDRLDEAEKAFAAVSAISEANRFPDAHKRLVAFGLGEIAMRRGSAEKALAFISPHIDAIMESRAHESNTETVRFHYVYKILKANQDARAIPYLEALYQYHHKQAEAIEDDALRQMFCENVTKNRAIRAAWAEHIAS